MKVNSLFVNQGDVLTTDELILLLSEFLSTIYFPGYTGQGEINGKIYDFQLIAEKKSPQLQNLELIDND